MVKRNKKNQNFGKVKKSHNSFHSGNKPKSMNSNNPDRVVLVGADKEKQDYYRSKGKIKL